MIVLAFIILLVQTPAATPSPTPMPSLAPPPQIPTPQQMMRVFAQFRPEFEESRRQLMAAVTNALTPQQHDAIATDIGANAVAGEPDATKLTSEIDGVLTPPARAAIAAAFTEYVVRQQTLEEQIQAAMPMQQSGNLHARLAGPTPQPVAFVSADAARLLAHQPMGVRRTPLAGPLTTFGSTVALMTQLRETMRAQMLAALTPAHRIAVGQLYGQAMMSDSYSGQTAGAQIDALLAPAERQAILSARAQYVADTTKQLEAIKAAAQQHLQLMGATIQQSLFDTMKQQLDALNAPSPAPVDAGTALLFALIVQPMTSAVAPPPTAAP
jgi:hypothetical protein